MEIPGWVRRVECDVLEGDPVVLDTGWAANQKKVMKFAGQATLSRSEAVPLTHSTPPCGIQKVKEGDGNSTG